MKHTPKVVKCMVNGGILKGDAMFKKPTYGEAVIDRIKEIVGMDPYGTKPKKETVGQRRQRTIDEQIDESTADVKAQ